MLATYAGLMLSERLRALPYMVHTNRELGSMLRGTKPLAVFGWTEGHEMAVVSRYLRMFDRHVANGRLLRRERVGPHSGVPQKLYRRISYALPGHEWRINVYEELWREPGAWTADHERKEGELLGYEDWQNDFWLARDWRPPPPK